MIDDPFKSFIGNLISPSEDCFAIEPHDINQLAQAPKAIFVGQGGSITLIPLRGSSAVTFYNLASGSVLDVRPKAILATGTTAAELVGLV